MGVETPSGSAMLGVLISHLGPRSLWPGFLKTPSGCLKLASAFLCTYHFDILPPKRAWAVPLQICHPPSKVAGASIKLCPFPAGVQATTPGCLEVAERGISSNRSWKGVSCCLLLAAGSRQGRGDGMGVWSKLGPRASMRVFQTPTHTLLAVADFIRQVGPQTLPPTPTHSGKFRDRLSHRLRGPGCFPLWGDTSEE